MTPININKISSNTIKNIFFNEYSYNRNGKNEIIKIAFK